MTTLDEWQEKWSSAPEPRLTPERCWLRVVEQAGEVARAIRTDRIDALGDGRLLAAPLASVIQFSGLVGFSLSEASWSKYPAICPYCISLAPGFELIADRVLEGNQVGGALEACSCPPPPKYGAFDPDAQWLAAFRARTDARPGAVFEWQAMFAAVYAHRHKSDLDRLAYHFIEEIGEVAKEVRLGDVRACSFETADVLSWILSLATTAGARLEVRIPLDDALDELFGEQSNA